MSKHNGVESVQVDPVWEWVNYGDLALVHAACKLFLAKRGIRGESWNRPFVFRRKKKPGAKNPTR